MLKIYIAYLILLVYSYSKLYQSVVLIRHGARYHVYDNVYDSQSTKPLWEQLTAVGMRQHQVLGKIIRNQYVNGLSFLSDNFNKKQIQVITTRYNRTLQSAESLLYGLYPPGKGPKLTLVDKKSAHLPPYSNKTDDQEQNFALPNGHTPIGPKQNDKIMLDINTCPNYQKQTEKNIQRASAEVNEMNVTYKPFLDKVASIFNLTSLDVLHITPIYDTIAVDRFLGRSIPSTFTEEDFLNLEHIQSWYYHLKLGGDVAGILNTIKINKILSIFDTRTRLPTTYYPKLNLLSGHDGDLITMNILLNISSSKCVEEQWRKGNTSALNCEYFPVFASSLIIELHSDDEIIFYVKIKYNGKYIYLCEKKDTKCSYSEWKSRVKKGLLSNIDSVCGRKISSILEELQEIEEREVYGEKLAHLRISEI